MAGGTAGAVSKTLVAPIEVSTRVDKNETSRVILEKTNVNFFFSFPSYPFLI